MIQIQKNAEERTLSKRKVFFLTLCIFMSGYCGIVAELSLFTLAESLAGGTLTNILATMGVMMFFMGVGAWLAGRNFRRKPGLLFFIILELTLSFSMMVSIPSMTYLCAWAPDSSILFFSLASAFIGVLIGLEIPIVQKLVQDLGGEDILSVSSSVLMADYFGGLVGFALFSTVLLHQFGLPLSTWSSGSVNFLSALLAAMVGIHSLKVWMKVVLFLFAFFSATMGYFINPLSRLAEQELYRHKIIWSRQTPYQKMILTDNEQKGGHEYDEKRFDAFEHLGSEVLSFKSSRGSAQIRKHKKEGYSLYINGGLQFNTLDEKYYHEFLVHTPLLLSKKVEKVLIMGGGDGLALRELVTYLEVEKIYLVDIDIGMIDNFKKNPLLKSFNQGSLEDPRLEIVIQDAWSYIRNVREKFDVIILDFPDPHHSQTAKLYTQQFYKFCRLSLAEEGVLITQATSPLLDRQVFQIIGKSMREAGFEVLSCHIEMESFLQWGFQLASLSLNENEMKTKLSEFKPMERLEFLNRESIIASFLWRKNFWSGYDALPLNDMMNLSVMHYYDKESNASP